MKSVLLLVFVVPYGIVVWGLVALVGFNVLEALLGPLAILLPLLAQLHGWQATRSISTSEPIQQAEITPSREAREVRCPKCRQTFKTMRRWRISCPKCGHQWEE